MMINKAEFDLLKTGVASMFDACDKMARKLEECVFGAECFSGACPGDAESLVKLLTEDIARTKDAFARAESAGIDSDWIENTRLMTGLRQAERLLEQQQQSLQKGK